MKFLLTCSAWLEAILKKEIEKQWWIITQTKDRLVFFEWPIELMAKLNLWSRVWNKLYLVLNSKKNIDNFDKLYDLVYDIEWKKYINRYYRVVTKATSIKSKLTSTPALQSITKKAIVDKMTSKSWNKMPEEDSKPIFEVLSFLIEDETFILLNTSWETLYKRWYKTDTWEAPIKESLAAALIILSNWKFDTPFYDIFCWSWTIAIEAVLFAKNIAPGLFRYFAFEDWNLLPENYFLNLRKEAKEKIFTKNYNIIASDIDENVLSKAIQNAKNAKVEDSIKFELKDFKEYKKEKIFGTLISNPPYWLRLKEDNIKNMYENIDFILQKNKYLSGWIITSYTDFNQIINQKNYKNRKLYNWNELAYFYLKKIN